MTWYTFFKSIHVVAAVIWVGGATTIQAYAFRILRTGDGKRQADFAKDTEIVGMRVFTPSSAVLFLAAIGLMVNGNWSWGQNWTVLGLIAFALSFVIGAGYLGPENSPEAQARIRRILMVSRAELVVLLAVIVTMVVKPTGQAGWFWGILAVMALGVIAVLVAHFRSEQKVPAPATTQ